MKFILFISRYMIPFFILYIVGYGILMKVPVYDSFVTGARDGMKTVLQIVPTLIGLMCFFRLCIFSGDRLALFVYHRENHKK